MILFFFLLPFFRLSTSLIYTLVVIQNVLKLIILFSALWWFFAIIFAYIINNTWGYRLKGFRFLGDAVLTMLSTMVLSSNETRLSFENEETADKIKFLILNIMIIYTLRFCIACQMTSLIIE